MHKEALNIKRHKILTANKQASIQKETLSVTRLRRSICNIAILAPHLLLLIQRHPHSYSVPQLSDSGTLPSDSGPLLSGTDAQLIHSPPLLSDTDVQPAHNTETRLHVLPRHLKARVNQTQHTERQIEVCNSKWNEINLLHARRKSELNLIWTRNVNEPTLSLNTVVIYPHRQLRNLYWDLNSSPARPRPHPHPADLEPLVVIGCGIYLM